MDVLHQDVSVGNVMLTEARSGGREQTGILNDWDHALKLDLEGGVDGTRAVS